MLLTSTMQSATDLVTHVRFTVAFPLPCSEHNDIACRPTLCVSLASCQHCLHHNYVLAALNFNGSVF